MTQRCMGCMELFGEEYTVCPHCGYAVGTQAEVAVHMEPGTVLHDRYIVGRVLGFGGFGVTYIGWDGKLEQKVAIKEYLPNEFSTRMPGKTMLTVFEGEKSEQFYDGMRKFTDEARRLAKFQNEEGIVKVYDSFEENCTAYIIMEYLEGETLTTFLEREKTIPEDRVVEMLKPIMRSLQVVHAAGILHRDIAPDNIFLTKSGEVKLIDFGASRYATTSHSRSLTVIIKPGYSPEEQYRSSGDQGPHTDVYALAATMYKAMTGKTPPDAMERRAAMESKNKDILVDPRKLNKDISVNRENAILNALNVRIEDRTPNIPEFMKELDMDPPAKRRYGAIKRLNFYAWPLWLKILLPTVLVAVLTVGILLLTGVIGFSKYKKEVQKPDGIVIAPDVEGLTYEEAIETIESRRLIAVVEGSLASEYITAGTIVKQTPIGGAFLQENGEVRLVTSSGTTVKAPVNGIATVPFIVGDTQDQAKQKFSDAGLAEPEIRFEYNEVIAEGLVVSSELAAEKTTAEGSKLFIVVSQGPAPFDMPDVVGKNEAEGKQILLDNKLKVVPEYENSDLPVGQIIRQSPNSGEQVKRGASVTIVVSSGKKIVTVPAVVGMTQEEATKELEKVGFEVFVAENNNEEVPVGNVISQTPEAGTSQEEGSKITIMVSKGKRDITVSYDLAGGKMEAGEKIVHVGEEFGDLPTPKRDGFTFDGWYTNLADGSTIHIKSNSIVEVDGDSITLTAAWRAVQATATPTPKPTNTPTPRPTNTPTPKPNTPTPTNKPTTIPDMTISYDANGGEGAPPSKTVKVGEKVQIGAAPSVSKTGHSFAGWSTSREGNVEYHPGDTYSERKSVVLYAVWEPSLCLITYYIDGNQNGSNYNFPVEYGTSLKIAESGTTKDYYHFVGWATKPGGEKQYSPGDMVTISGPLNLYALFVENTVSGWVLDSDKPSNARVVEEKWTYKKTVQGTWDYCYYWPGFNQNHEMYNKYHKGPYEKTSKTVSVTEKGVVAYLCYHWCRGGNVRPGGDNRRICPWRNPYEYDGLTAFHCFVTASWASTYQWADDDESRNNYGAPCENLGRSYMYNSNGNGCNDSYWFYVMPIHRQEYIEQESGESEKEISGSEYSDIKHYVRYQEK